MVEHMNMDVISEYDRDEVEELLNAIEEENWKVKDIDLDKNMGQKHLDLELVK